MTDVLSKNLFDLLDAEESGDFVEVQTSKDSKKEKKAGGAKKAEGEVKKADNTRAKPGENRVRNDYPKRGGYASANVVSVRPSDRVESREGGFRGDRPPRLSGERGERGERGSFRGRGGRGRGGGRGGYRQRDFDRHSATDRYDGEKKEVAGKGSWGDPITSEAEQPQEVVEGAASAEGAEGNVEKPAGEEVEAEKKEESEEEKQLTLEQYLAQKTAKKAVVETAPAPRKANEGADDGQWKDAVMLKKEDEEFLVLGAKEKRNKNIKEKSSKVMLDIEQRFNDEPSRRGGRGRGGRGGERRDYGGRGSRGPRQVNVEDPNAFPSLK
ncbi:hypothetical protein HK102_002863 [Quaeritorhiza haematococci]|nr:hypothetical protein HK102_002863 [Quaeritorhiza haematococci]